MRGSHCQKTPTTMEIDGMRVATMEQFKLKDVDEVSAYLKECGIDACVCEKFEGKSTLSCRPLYMCPFFM